MQQTHFIRADSGLHKAKRVLFAAASGLVLIGTLTACEQGGMGEEENLGTQPEPREQGAVEEPAGKGGDVGGFETEQAPGNQSLEEKSRDERRVAPGELETQ